MSTCGVVVVVVVGEAKWLTVANPLWILPDLNHLIFDGVALYVLFDSYI